MKSQRLWQINTCTVGLICALFNMHFIFYYYACRLCASQSGSFMVNATPHKQFSFTCRVFRLQNSRLMSWHFPYITRPEQINFPISCKIIKDLLVCQDLVTQVSHLAGEDKTYSQTPRETHPSAAKHNSSVSSFSF